MKTSLNILKLLLLFCTAMATIAAQAQRQEIILRDGWKFSRGEELDAHAPAQISYDDSKWQTVQVPHDWAISGPFNKDIDKQVVAIEQNGEKEATEKTGRSGALPWVGQGWYRTTFSVEEDCPRAILNFDGAMAEPEVFVNGKKAGEWKYGYTPFNIDITEYIHKDGSPNTLAVHLQNVEESSRWYPGAGLIRPVKLITTGKCHFSEWGINVETQYWNWAETTATIQLTAFLDGNLEGNSIVRFSTHGRTIDVTPERTDDRGGAFAATELTMNDVECWSDRKSVV